MGRIRDKEGYERLRAFVDEVFESSIAEDGWSRLDDAQQAEAREARLGVLREIVRDVRRSEADCEGLSARRRWLAMAYDEAVEKYAARRPTRQRRRKDTNTTPRSEVTQPVASTRTEAERPQQAPTEAAVPRRPTAQERSRANRALVDALAALDPVLVMAVSRDDVASATEAICLGGSTATEEAERLAMAHGRAAT